MELVAIVRALWRRRLIVAVGAVLALLIFLHGAYKVSSSGISARDTTQGIATRKVFVDTPQSMLGNAWAKGAESIGGRTQLLGNLMASDPARVALAQRTGIPASELEIEAPGLARAAFPSTLAEASVGADKPKAPYLVSIGENYGLQFLTISAVASDVVKAEALVDGTIAELDALGAGDASLGGRLTVEGVGNRAAWVRTGGTSKVKVALEAIVFFVVWLVFATVVDAIARRRRRGRRAVWRAAGA